jgi:hypothetical protein
MIRVFPDELPRAIMLEGDCLIACITRRERAAWARSRSDGSIRDEFGPDLFVMARARAYLWSDKERVAWVRAADFRLIWSFSG